MKTKEIIDLIDFISKSEINEVNIETPEFKVFVKKRPDIRVTETVQPQSAPAHHPAQLSESPGPESKPAVEESASNKNSNHKNVVEIRSPMIGTFFTSPNPGAPPFVKVGDKIKQGQTVCIVEAIKLFNEIESEVTGIISEVLVENASPVEYDQPLFLVEPA